MEVRLRPDLQAKLDEWTAQTGRGADELVEDALTGYFEELSELRSTIESRYDDLELGRVKPMTADELFARLREKSEGRRTQRND
jgi:hypothetical protein